MSSAPRSDAARLDAPTAGRVFRVHLMAADERATSVDLAGALNLSVAEVAEILATPPPVHPVFDEAGRAPLPPAELYEERRRKDVLRKAIHDVQVLDARLRREAQALGVYATVSKDGADILDATEESVSIRLLADDLTMLAESVIRRERQIRIGS
jgi:hypothetical protein